MNEPRFEPLRSEEFGVQQNRTHRREIPKSKRVIHELVCAQRTLHRRV
jgi:hypothetical protein